MLLVFSISERPGIALKFESEMVSLPMSSGISGHLTLGGGLSEEVTELCLYRMEMAAVVHDVFEF